jgi:OmpA-OmpF porin, OOP family
MNKRFFPSVITVATLLAIAAASASAQGSTLTPAKDRISDDAIAADQLAYEALQGRIKGLNDKGRAVRDYHLSKAQCWLDVSLHEYTRNDRGAFPQAALSESEKLIQAMERAAGPLPMDTPLVNDAERLRPDLWARAQALKADSGFKCAQQKTACAEVELVHAGNEHKQQQWRHAKPYVQIAEDLLGEAQVLAASCAPTPAPPVAVAPKPAVAVAPAPAAAPASAPVSQNVQLSAGVLFNFDKFDAKNMRPLSVVQLEELVHKVEREKLVLKSIQLSGYADRLNSTGKGDYNLRLSERRVATVRAELARLGVAPALMSTVAGGDTRQVQGCEQRFTRKADLQECLLPNRRVEVVIDARIDANKP